MIEEFQTIKSVDERGKSLAVLNESTAGASFICSGRVFEDWGKDSEGTITKRFTNNSKQTLHGGSYYRIGLESPEKPIDSKKISNTSVRELENLDSDVTI